MQSKLRFSKAVVGAFAGTAFMLVVLALSQYGIAGWTAAVILAAAGGIALTHVGARLHELSIIDDGTGLYNRRYLFRRLELELNQAKRGKAPLGLTVIDVDDFRQYNNRYGHLAGDAVLQAVARTLRSTVRKGDIVGRWGGEEFALILPGADAHEAMAVTERVRKQVADLKVDIGGALVEQITISAGVAAFHNSVHSVRELVQRADEAMYNAKQQKNKVLPFMDSADFCKSHTLYGS